MAKAKKLSANVKAESPETSGKPGPVVPEPVPVMLEPVPVVPEPGPVVPEPVPVMLEPGTVVPEPPKCEVRDPLWELYVARVAKAETVNTMRRDGRAIFRDAFVEAKVALDVYLEMTGGKKS